MSELERLRELASRLAAAPADTAARAARSSLPSAYQAGALEQVCRSAAAELALIIGHLEQGQLTPAPPETADPSDD